MSEADVVRALLALWNELAEGAAADGGVVLNRKDPGLFRSLDRLSAEHASALPPDGGASIAAHVDHLRYGLELLNRWSKGEDPFGDADYAASWSRTAVSNPEWAARREALRREAQAWREAMERPRRLGASELTNMLGSVVHLAYHLGAMRQIERAMRGPSAQD